MSAVNAATVAAVLDKAKRTGAGWQACCPAHDDHNPSLSISDEGDKVLVHCHAGCDQRAVVDAIEARGIHLNGNAARLDGPPDTHPKLGCASAIWDYYADDGRHVGRVMRFDTATGKEIRQASHNGMKWTWKAMPEPRPIYRLREVQRRPEAVVLITEGEKAADAAQWHFPAHVAVTWAGGAKAVTHADWRALAGRSVILWPDADEPGRLAMDALARILKSHGCTVHMVDLAAFGNVPEGWDAADWTSEQVTRFRTVPFIESRMEVRSSDQSGPQKTDGTGNRPAADVLLVGFDLSELMGPIPPERELVPGVPAEAYTLVAGGLATAKTTFLHSLILSRATGYDFLNIAATGITPGPCVLVSYEDADSRIVRRFQILVQHQYQQIVASYGQRAGEEYLALIGLNLRRVTLTGKSGCGIVCRGVGGNILPNHALIDELIDKVRAFASRDVLIGLDPLRLAIVGSQSDDDGADVVVHTLNDIASRLPDSGLIVPSHTTKAGAVEPGKSQAAAAYSTSGSALYSQHARSNFLMSRLTPEEVNKTFSADEVTREETERQRVVQLTHARLSHGPEAEPRYYVMRGGVLVPVRPNSQTLALAEQARRSLAAIYRVTREIAAQGHRVSRKALESAVAVGRTRNERRDFIAECVTQGWLQETGTTTDKRIEFTSAGLAQLSPSQDGESDRKAA